MCFTNRTVNNFICSSAFSPSCTSVTYLKAAPSAPDAGVHSSQVGKKEKLLGQSKHKKLRCGSYTIDELMSTLFTLNGFENSAFAAHFH